jgi:RNA polymerase-binding transcription factor DksA
MSTDTALPPVGMRDKQRDLNALTWDLTVHQLHQAFARWAFPEPAAAGGDERAAELARVRVAAARHAVENMRAALRRIEAGTYGICQQCGGTIATDRMQDRPTTRWCTACQG